jgi:hypothetical protein
MWFGDARTAAVTVLLVLGLAPMARAHGGQAETDAGGVTHRDTPAELAGADINHALATGRLTSRSTAALPQYLPTTWCGSRHTADDTSDAAFPLSAAQIKVVYAYAAGQPNRSALWSDSLQGDASNIEQYLALQSGGRQALRFDMGTECGPQYVDIQVVALPRSRAAYLDDFGQVADDVAARVDFAHGPRNVLILADNLTDDGVYGTGEVLPQSDDPDPGNLHNAGGLTGIMWVTASTTPNASGWQPTVALHEMTHNLGGVSWSAPHSTHPDDGDPMDGTYSHCWDGQDVMCYADGPDMAHAYEDSHCPLAGGAIPQTYDCGHDDYYDPAPANGTYLATHWNVHDSVFMGSCTHLGTACGADVVATPPVNQGAPAIAGGASAQRGVTLTGSAGTWLNTPSSYRLQWQRAVGPVWTDVPGATAPTYVPSGGDVGAPLRMVVTAANDDGAAVAASAPTRAVADFAASPPVTSRRTLRVRIRLRDRARRTAGTLTANVRTIGASREVATAATRVALPAGTWRLRLCAGRSSGTLRCALTARVRTRHRGVRLPSAQIVVPTRATLLVTAAAVDARLRVRAHGQAASV